MLTQQTEYLISRCARQVNDSLSEWVAKAVDSEGSTIAYAVRDEHVIIRIEIQPVRNAEA